MAEAKELNVWQKLLKARKEFSDADKKQSGKNLSLEFKYYELKDIVPIATDIFTKVGLIGVPKFAEDEASLTIVNTAKPEETIVFTAPMRYPDVNRGVNAIQVLGSAITYLRRYLYMMALDICEPDSVDPNLTKEKPVAEVKPVVVSKKPATPVQRQEIKKEITDADGKPDEMQIKALKSALKKLKEVDPNQEDFIKQIIAKTEQFKNLTKDSCEKLILKIGEMIKEIDG